MLLNLFLTVLPWELQKQVRIEDWIDDLGEEIQGRLGVTGGEAAFQSATDARCDSNVESSSASSP